jgi:hypothetical protein
MLARDDNELTVYSAVAGASEGSPRATRAAAMSTAKKIAIVSNKSFIANA